MMLKLRDFLHLPQLDALVQQLVNDGPGLVILAGIDSRPSSPDSNSSPDQLPSGGLMKPSGLSAIFSILIQEILLAKPLSDALVVSEDRELSRVPRQLQRRVGYRKVEPDFPYPYQIDLAAKQKPGLLVIDQINAETAVPAFRAAARGVRVLAQFDTVLHGSAVAREMIDMGVPHGNLAHLRWVLTTQRMPVLCPHCKTQTDLNPDQAARLGGRYPQLVRLLADIFMPPEEKKKPQTTRTPAGFFRAAGCMHCKGTGYQGDLSIFDLYRNDPEKGNPFDQPSLLSLEEYALHLASQGEIDLDDLLNLEASHLRRTYHLLTASEKALSTANSSLNRKLFELEASNRVLVQRTEVLMSLEELGQALIGSTPLHDLAARVCRRAGDLCGAERVVLYLRRVSEIGEETAEILAARGWEIAAADKHVPPAQVFQKSTAEGRATRYMSEPPGVRPAQGSDVNARIVVGLRVPLISQDQLVGVMIVQCTHKDTFTPGQAALLQTFANQAALAIQRAGLIDDLRAKISELEAAQAELVMKERMEREMELARQVQQSMLPHSFPTVKGYTIAARNQPARQVGGDFYDMVVLDDDHFGVVVADVADKGMPAALYMGLSRSLFRAEARRERSPRSVLVNVNRLLLELGEMNGFVSVFYGVIERSTNMLVYARAGHERPLLLHDGHSHNLGGEGTVLGILDESELHLSEERIQLNPGDYLVLYTDGLTDTTDSNGAFFRLERLQHILETHTGETPEVLCDTIFSLLEQYRGQAEQFDDMTLLVISCEGQIRSSAGQPNHE